MTTTDSGDDRQVSENPVVDMFLEFAGREGWRQRCSEAEFARLAKAFMRGFACGNAYTGDLNQLISSTQSPAPTCGRRA